MYSPLESVTVVGAITSVAVLLNCAPAMAAVKRTTVAVRRTWAKARMRNDGCMFGAVVRAFVSGLRSLWGFGQLAPLFGPLRLVLLTPAADRQRVPRDRLGDHRTGCHVSARADFERRDQGRVAADK